MRRRFTRHLPGPKLSATFLNTAKHFKTIRYGCGSVPVIFSINLNAVLYNIAINTLAFESAYRFGVGGVRNIPSLPRPTMLTCIYATVLVITEGFGLSNETHEFRPKI